jgi:hypothetical protein
MPSVGSKTPKYISATPGEPKRLTSQTGGTLFYDVEEDVSTESENELEPGEGVELTAGNWIISETETVFDIERVVVEFATKAELAAAVKALEEKIEEVE